MVLLIRILYVFSPLSIYRRNAWVKKFAIPKNGEREAWKGDSERYSNRYEERVTLQSSEQRYSHDEFTPSLVESHPSFFFYTLYEIEQLLLARWKVSMQASNSPESFIIFSYLFFFFLSFFFLSRKVSLIEAFKFIRDTR